MSPRICRLDGRQRTKQAVLAKLGRDLGWTGRKLSNLDALYDVLVRELRGPLEVHWIPSETARDALGSDYARIASVLRDAAEQRPDLTVELG